MNSNIIENPFAVPPQQYQFENREVQQCARRLINEGYLQTGPVISENETRKRAQADLTIILLHG